MKVAAVSIVPHANPVRVDPTVPVAETNTPVVIEPAPVVSATNKRRMNRAVAATFAVVCGAALVVAGALSIGPGSIERNGGPGSVPTLESQDPASAERAAAPQSVHRDIQGRPTSGMLRGSEAGIRNPDAPKAPTINISWATATIRRSMNRIAGIYSMLGARGAAPAGTVAVHLEIEPDGHVGRAWLEEDSLRNTEFSGEVMRELIKAEFGPTGLSQAAGLIVPIEFDATGSRLLSVALHDARMPGDAAIPEMPAIASRPNVTEGRDT